MRKLNELIKYILHTYPKPEELSKPRLVKLIYLIDWKYAIDNGKQFTDINWIYHHYGPYVNDVIEIMKQNSSEFEVISRVNPYGGTTDKFRLNQSKQVSIEIEPKVKVITDFFISKTVHLSWSNFISVVYSTYPVKSNLQYSSLDLESLAQEFNTIKTTANTG